MGTSSIPSNAPGRHQRKLRNYLLDSRLQLRYTGYMVAVALVIGGALGLGLWRTGTALVHQTERAVQSGEKAVSLGRTVLGESQKVSAVVNMNIQNAYADAPELRDAFQAESSAQAGVLAKQQRDLEQQALALKEQAEQVKAQRGNLLVLLPLVCLALVIAIAAMGIYVTHKVAGPIYKMKRQLAEVGAGRLRIPQPLRKGDELVSFFEAFDTMVKSLRGRQEDEIRKLDQALERLGSKADPAHLTELKALRAEMQAALDA